MPSAYWQSYQTERKAEVVEAARMLFSRRGIENTTMEEIADKTGIGVASLYRYYVTKAQIAVAVGIDYWNQIEKAIDPIFKSEAYQAKTGMGKIEAIMDIYPLLLQEHRDFLLYLDDLDSFILRNNIQAKDLGRYEESIAQFYGPYIEAVHEGQKDGTIKKGLDEKLLFISVNQTMMALIRKMAHGEILATNSLYQRELTLVVEMIKAYVRSETE